MAGERYECKLSPELLAKAVEELNEPSDNKMRLEAIDSLRTRFNETENDLELVRSDDAFLLRFLRFRKFNEDKAYESLKNYHLQRRDWPEVFNKVDNPASISHFLDIGPCITIGPVAYDNSFVVFGRMGMGFNETIDIHWYVAVIVLTMEKLLEDEAFQIHGLTVVDDYANFTISAAAQMVYVGKNFHDLLMESLPLRVKSINLLNEGLVFDIIYTVINKFMKEKMKRRLHVYGNKYEGLHDIIPPDKLPREYGGTGPALRPEEWRKELVSSLGEGESTTM